MAKILVVEDEKNMQEIIIEYMQRAVMLALFILSAFVSALLGLFIGRISDGMMV